VVWLCIALFQLDAKVRKKVTPQQKKSTHFKKHVDFFCRLVCFLD
jgi:hypothetical protein